MANYAEFVEREKSGELVEILKPARDFFAGFEVIDLDQVRKALAEALDLVATQTGIGGIARRAVSDPSDVVIPEGT